MNTEMARHISNLKLFMREGATASKRGGQSRRRRVETLPGLYRFRRLGIGKKAGAAF